MINMSILDILKTDSRLVFKVFFFYEHDAPLKAERLTFPSLFGTQTRDSFLLSVSVIDIFIV